MDVSQARRLKELEKENRRLKKLVADLSLDVQILKDVNTASLLELQGGRIMEGTAAMRTHNSVLIKRPSGSDHKPHLMW